MNADSCGSGSETLPKTATKENGEKN